MDERDTATSPSAKGILHCLRLLAQEAAALNLVRTLVAIEDARDMAAHESGLDTNGESFSPMPPRPIHH